MGNDNGGPPNHQPFDRLLDEHFGLGVDRGSSFIKDQNRGILEHRAGDGKTLLLPAGKLNPTLADQGVVAIREVFDKFMGVRDFGCGHHLFFGGIWAAKQDIIAHAAVEKEYILEDNADLLAERIECKIAQVMPIQGDTAAADIIKTRDQADHGRFAHTGRTDQRDYLLSRDFQRDALEDWLSLAVLETHIVEDDLAVRALFERNRAGTVA